MDMLVLVVVAQVLLVRVDHPMLIKMQLKLHLMVLVVLDFQVPTTFRNPFVTYDGVHTDAQWYLGGGGGGGLFNPNPQTNPDRGGKGGGGAGGGGAPGIPGSRGGAGGTNTGGGGGGSGSFNDPTVFYGGHGGSGIVLIAYPT